MATKVLHILNKISGGGAERVATTLSIQFEPFYEQLIQTFYLNKENKYNFKGAFSNLNAPSHKSNPFSKINALIKRYNGTKKTKNNYNPQVSISHLFVPNLINILSSKNDKTICVLHGSASLYNNSSQKKLARMLYPKADAIIAVSKFYRQKCINELKTEATKTYCIYNPIDFSAIQEKIKEPLADEHQWLENKEFIVNIGRMTELKGHWHALRIFKEVQKTHNALHLVFLGDGPKDYIKKLKTFSEFLSISKNVHFLGNVENPFKYIAKAKIMLHTSMREGLPMVLIETLACAVPIVSSDCTSGPREILSPDSDITIKCLRKEETKFGYLCPTPDWNFDQLQAQPTIEELEFVLAVQELLEKPNLYKQIKSSTVERAKYFDTEKIISDYKSLFQKLSTSS